MQAGSFGRRDLPPDLPDGYRTWGDVKFQVSAGRGSDQICRGLSAVASSRRALYAAGQERQEGRLLVKIIGTVVIFAACLSAIRAPAAGIEVAETAERISIATDAIEAAVMKAG